jgi:hypothetical protein
VTTTPAEDRAASLEWYSTPGPFTALGGHELAIDRNPDGRPSIASVVAAVQGILVYDLAAKPFYGVELSAERSDDIDVRPVAELLDRATAIDPRPLGAVRAPERRITGRCHTYAKLTVAILRACGVPARARCGFGAYFRPGYFEDHWAAEYWDDEQARWIMVDAQLDAAWIGAIGFGGDPLDLRDDEFVTAGRAWQDWRGGVADADRYGLSAIDEHGAFWIAGNLRLDVTALDKIEMLPWDVWGEGWEPDQPIPDDLSIFDTMSELADDPDANLAALRALADHDPRVHMPGTVFNVNRQRLETVPLPAPDGA